MSVLVATDLDRTMIYSRSFSPTNGNGNLCVEMYNDAPLSYMTLRAAKEYALLSAMVPLIPATTRTREQFDRISLPGVSPRYAVVSNGARILCEGVDDGRWRSRIEREVAKDSVSLAELHAELLARIDDSWCQSVRIADDIFVYLVVDIASLPADFCQSWQQWCLPRGWKVSQQGRKIYAMPVGVTKSAAVKHVWEALIEEGAATASSVLLAAGDGRLDVDLLELADFAIRPAHGELHDSQWSSPELSVTTTAGIDAGEEILMWFRQHLTSISDELSDSTVTSTRQSPRI